MATMYFTLSILLTLLHQAEPSAETSVFVQKGQDVRLNVQTNVQLQDVDVIFWKFNRSVNVVKYPPKVTFERYQVRAELIVGDFSLLLKNLQEGDSGLYDAVVSGSNDRNVAAYLIEVQERVESPVLTVDSNSTINGICNVTVTCRGQNTSVTSSCNSSTCSQVGESRRAETSTVPLLSVYVAGGSIICNHSNQVSWANDTKEIKTICVSNSDQEDHTYRVILILIVCGIAIIIIIIIIVLIRQKQNGGDIKDIINTDYATVGTPDNSQAGGEQQMSPGPASPTIYSMVGHPQPQPVNHQPLPVDLPMTTMAPMTSMPESLYAMVGKKTSKQ
ncbi:natural killer cell receptor 2B4-like isoform X2 [Oncorhynchus nerka]|uniref:natural killer cell receptor 2B4-like isoform X2 n=1 Tax=Oncorhynchus nerka TaxID=8023 RepID=UPI001131DC56|nr:natural killer cell receptor 2B4-like isoform X2 [Oncorhynchus nerka]